LIFFVLLLSYLSPSLFSTVEVSSPYECGFEPSGASHVPFCMKFFLLAIFFIVFDVEVCFLFPALFSSSLLFSFLLVLLLGLLFEYAYGGLSWVA